MSGGRNFSTARWTINLTGGDWARLHGRSTTESGPQRTNWIWWAHVRCEWWTAGAKAKSVKASEPILQTLGSAGYVWDPRWGYGLGEQWKPRGGGKWGSGVVELFFRKVSLYGMDSIPRGVGRVIHHLGRKQFWVRVLIPQPYQGRCAIKINSWQWSVAVGFKEIAAKTDLSKSLWPWILREGLWLKAGWVVPFTSGHHRFRGWGWPFSGLWLQSILRKLDPSSKCMKYPCMQTVGLWAQDPLEEKWVRVLGILRVASPS